MRQVFEIGQAEAMRVLLNYACGKFGFVPHENDKISHEEPGVYFKGKFVVKLQVPR